MLLSSETAMAEPGQGADVTFRHPEADSAGADTATVLWGGMRDQVPYSRLMGEAPAAKVTRTRRRVDPARRRLAGAVAMVSFGSFLPWIDTAVGSVSGARGAGLWTFYAALLGLAGALVPKRRAAAVQAAIFAAVALLLPVWQVVRLLGLVGTAGWVPGPGLVLVLGGGVLGASAAAQLFRPRPPDDAGPAPGGPRPQRS
jgi:hypothetical protein